MKSVVNNAEISDLRRSVYIQKTDPLLNEARIKRLLGDDEDADALEIRALELRIKIQEDLPYSQEG